MPYPKALLEQTQVFWIFGTSS